MFGPTLHFDNEQISSAVVAEKPNDDRNCLAQKAIN